MIVLGIIPARFSSSRFPGKPLADIFGKPMIWWVYNQVIKSELLSKTIVAIDDIRIEKVCKKWGIPYVMTKSDHPDHIARIQEVSCMIKADRYVCINGDEPLISAESIDEVIKSSKIDDFFVGAFRFLSDPVETIDPGNIKIVTNSNSKCVYMSRTPVPYPKGSLLFNYKKYVGIENFSKEALDFYISTSKGFLENIEDIDHLRFIENNKPMTFVEIDSDSISVDTMKDLEKVKLIISSQYNGKY